MKRDDSSTKANQLLSVLRLVRDSLPNGYGNEQEAAIEKTKSHIESALIELGHYIDLRITMK